MNLKILNLLLFASTAPTVVAFAPPQRLASVTTAAPSISSGRQSHPVPLAPRLGPQQRETTATTLFAGPDNPFVQADLFVGMFAVLMGATPYALQIFLPKQLNNWLFSAVYEDTTEGRAAEIGFKTRFATLGMVITLLSFVDIYYFAERDVSVVLRQQYIAWAVFYVSATLKIRREALADPPVFAKDSRVGIQAWHIFVAVLLWADVSESYTGHAIETFVRRVVGAELIA